MKTTKSLTFSQIILLLNCLVLCMLPVLLPAQQVSQKFKFKNTEGEGNNATDLHVEFTRDATLLVPSPNLDSAVVVSTPANAFKLESGTGTKKVNLANGDSGIPIAHEETVCITVTHMEGTVSPKVRRWFWTNSNTVDEESSVRMGRVKGPRIVNGAYVGTEPSTGDGSVLLTIDDESHTFEIPPGQSSEDVASAFVSFVNDQFEFGEALILEGSEFEVFSRAHTNEIDDIFVSVVPDSTMGIEWTYIPETIPTLSEWGVIILILLTLAVGMVFLYRRETALALAGNIQAGSSSSKPKLFDKRLYAIVFGVVLLIGLTLLGLAYLYFGEITSADPFGTFASSAIVAYMVHFWILRKSQSE